MPAAQPPENIKIQQFENKCSEITFDLYCVFFAKKKKIIRATLDKKDWRSTFSVTQKDDFMTSKTNSKADWRTVGCSRWAATLDKWSVVDFLESTQPCLPHFFLPLVLCKSIILAHAGPDVLLTVKQKMTRAALGLLLHPKYSNESVLELTTHLTNFTGPVLAHE